MVVEEAASLLAGESINSCCSFVVVHNSSDSSTEYRMSRSAYRIGSKRARGWDVPFPGAMVGPEVDFFAVSFCEDAPLLVVILVVSSSSATSLDIDGPDPVAPPPEEPVAVGGTSGATGTAIPPPPDPPSGSKKSVL